MELLQPPVCAATPQPCDRRDTTTSLCVALLLVAPAGPPRSGGQYVSFYEDFMGGPKIARGGCENRFWPDEDFLAARYRIADVSFAYKG